MLKVDLRKDVLDYDFVEFAFNYANNVLKEFKNNTFVTEEAWDVEDCEIANYIVDHSEILEDLEDILTEVVSEFSDKEVEYSREYITMEVKVTRYTNSKFLSEIEFKILNAQANPFMGTATGLAEFKVFALK